MDMLSTGIWEYIEGDAHVKKGEHNMKPENEWFRPELQRPVKPESGGISSKQPVTNPDPPWQDEFTYYHRGAFSYGHGSLFESEASWRMEPPDTPSPEKHPDFSKDIPADLLHGRSADLPPDNPIYEPPYDFPDDEMMHRKPYSNPDLMPETGYGPKGISPSWENDRALKTRHSQTVGKRGPVLEQDSLLHEALEIFTHTKILERAVHVKGFGAFGYFRTMHSMREYTKLCFLQNPGQQVPVMVRFSLAAGNKGTPDTSRNVRGFSTKFYTEEGVFDLLCNHIPVLFVRDGIRFPEAFTSLAPSPASNLTDPERFWRFAARAPEATHFITWLYSDTGTIRSLRHIRAFGVNTYVWKNAEGVRRYVKYHWIPLAGEACIDRREATMLAGLNPDIAGKDLYDAIAAGNPVQYELRVQLMDPRDESGLPYDPLDCTKVWDEQCYPLVPVGRLTLNRNPDNYMEQVEKAAFSPANLLEGAELSNDKLLQARANIYWDSQRRRLGEDFRSIPVNRQESWSPDEQITSGDGTHAEGPLIRSGIPKQDDFTQAGERYHSLSPMEQDHLVDNLAADLAAVSAGTQSVVLKYLHSASPELGERVAAQIGIYARQQY
jgi:catalase